MSDLETRIDSAEEQASAASDAAAEAQMASAAAMENAQRVSDLAEQAAIEAQNDATEQVLKNEDRIRELEQWRDGAESRMNDLFQTVATIQTTLSQIQLILKPESESLATKEPLASQNDSNQSETLEQPPPEILIVPAEADLPAQETPARKPRGKWL